MKRKCAWTKDTISGFWHVGCQLEDSECSWWDDGDHPEEWEFCPYCGGHIEKWYQGEEL